MPKVQTYEHQADGNGRARRGRRVATSLSEINVVPLVDVMLVLLIIFMVTAPMMQRGVDVNLPVSRRAPADQQRAAVRHRAALLSQTDRVVLLGDEPIRIDVLQERIRQAMVTRADKEVFLRGDGGVQLQELMEVMDRLKKAASRRSASSRLPRAPRRPETVDASRRTTSEAVSDVLQRPDAGAGRVPVHGRRSRSWCTRRRSAWCSRCRPSWIGRESPAVPRTVMTISLGRGAGAARRRADHDRGPPGAAGAPSRRRKTSRRSAAGAQGAGDDAAGSGRQGARAKPAARSAPDQARGRTPTTRDGGARGQRGRGDRRPRTGVRAVARAGAAPAGISTSANFCCPDYLVTMMELDPAELEREAGGRRGGRW